MTELFNGEDDRRRFPRGAADEFAFEKFKGAVTLRRSTPQIGLIPTQIIPNNPDRVSFVISNVSGIDIRIGWDQQITTGLGILVPASGGWIQGEVDRDGGVIGWAVFGVSTVAATQLYVIEIIRYKIREG